MVEKMKAIAFEKVTDKVWKSTAEDSLRRRSFETLTTKLIEDLEIQPLYTNESAVTEDVRQKMQQIIQHSKVHPSWRIIQPTYANDAITFIEKAEQSLQNGNEAIYYDGRCGIEWSNEDLKRLMKIVTKRHPLCVQHVDENDSFLNLFHMMDKSERHKVRGPILNGAKSIQDDFINLRNTHIS